MEIMKIAVLKPNLLPIFPRTLYSVISLKYPFLYRKAGKSIPFRASPLRIGHYREYQLRLKKVSLVTEISHLTHAAIRGVARVLTTVVIGLADFRFHISSKLHA